MAARRNKEVAAFLEEVGVLMELKGENAFRVRAYANAARAIEMLDEDVALLAAEERLTQVRGVGKGLAGLVGEFLQRGTADDYEALKAEIPRGLLDMLRIPGLGPKKIRAIHQHLGAESLEALEQACRQGRLDGVSGFGKKTQENILKGIEHLRRYQDRYRIDQAREALAPVLETLEKDPATLRAVVAGSLRRCRETAGDVDLLLSSRDPEQSAELFAGHEAVAQILARGQTKTSVRLHIGLQADLRIVAEDEFPCALHYFTGSKEHNVQMRARAQERGLKLNEYGLFRGEERLPITSEEALFAALDLAYIPPELREGLGEIEAAAADGLPELVRAEDVRGMLHVHSTYSDGADSLEDMALAARERGYQYLGIADHSRSAAYAGGLSEDEVLRQHEEIDALQEKLGKFRLFKGIESDILADGLLDYGDAFLERFDFVVASVHSRFQMSEAQMTERILRAVEHPATTMLGHLTGRLLLEREGYAVDVDAVIEACAARGVAIEINADPHRLDIDWRHLRKARDRGVKIAVNTDAHRIAGLDYIGYGIGLARKGWLGPRDIINTLPTKEIAAYFRRC